MVERVGPRAAPARAGAVFTVELDGQAVLLDEDANRLHLLNHTGTLLWLLYDGQTSLAELAGEVATELELELDTVLRDVVAITRQLAAEGLLA